MALVRKVHSLPNMQCLMSFNAKFISFIRMIIVINVKFRGARITMSYAGYAVVKLKAIQRCCGSSILCDWILLHCSGCLNSFEDHQITMWYRKISL